MSQIIIIMESSHQAVTTVLAGTRIKMLVPVCSHEDVKKMLSLLEY